MINNRISAVWSTTSALVWTSCKRGVQENGAIGLVLLQTAEILVLITVAPELVRQTRQLPDQ